jgi:hypothetical protein
MKRALWIGAAIIVLGGGLFAYLRLRDSLARGPAPTPAEIQALSEERRRLRNEFRDLLNRENVLDFANAPAGNILVGVPTSFAEDLVRQMVTGLFSKVRLHLRNIEAHAEGEVKAKVLFTQKVGRYVLDVRVKDIHALLKPGPPELEFGGDRIGIRLPVSVAEGHGSGSVHFQWQGKGLAGAVCGDLDVSPDISSDVKPRTYTVGGEFQLAAVGESLLARPRFGEIVLKVVLQPTEKTWEVLQATVEDIKEDKNGVCGMAIRKINIRGIVQKIIDKGFDVKLPPKLFRDVSLPARIEQTVTLKDRTVSLEARPLGLRVTPLMLWYGVAMGAEAAASSPPSS